MPKLFQQHSEFDLTAGNAEELLSDSLMHDWQNDGKTRGSDLSQKLFVFVLFFYFTWQYIENFCKCALRSKVSILKRLPSYYQLFFTDLVIIIILDLGKLTEHALVSHTGFVYMQHQQSSLYSRQ